jgi:hypothetical protein
MNDLKQKGGSLSDSESDSSSSSLDEEYSEDKIKAEEKAKGP